MGKKNNSILVIILWLVAIHSFIVGIGLIITPSDFFEYLGYNKCIERFFPTQGGVFHIVMAIGYALGAVRFPDSNDLVIFSIIVKFCATLFLMLYFFFIMQTWIIFISGIVDCLMGITILWAYSRAKNKVKI